MATTPVAKPSSPSTKLTALEHNTMKKTVIAIEAVSSRAMLESFNGIHSIFTPWATTMPAASTWPANLASAFNSKMSSRTPTAQITAAAMITARAS